MNNDTFKFVEETSTFDFSQTPPRTDYNRELRDVEYGTSYNDTGDYGKIIMFVRNIGSWLYENDNSLGSETLHQWNQ